VVFSFSKVALKSIQGSTIFATATKFKKMMSDFNFNQIPSEIKYFIPADFRSNSICFCNSMEYFLTESIIVCSLSLIVVIVSSNKDSYLVSLILKKKKFLNIKRQADQTEKTIIHHQDEIIAALKSIQGSTIFATATKFKKILKAYLKANLLIYNTYINIY
jgi:hypothetical protein